MEFQPYAIFHTKTIAHTEPPAGNFSIPSGSRWVWETPCAVITQKHLLICEDHRFLSIAPLSVPPRSDTQSNKSSLSSSYPPDTSIPTTPSASESHLQSNNTRDEEHSNLLYTLSYSPPRLFLYLFPIHPASIFPSVVFPIPSFHFASPIAFSPFLLKFNLVAVLHK